jgi:hypothetical protein
VFRAGRDGAARRQRPPRRAHRSRQGGLVTSLYGDDRASLGALALELAPWHGRLVLVDAKIA